MIKLFDMLIEVLVATVNSEKQMTSKEIKGIYTRCAKLYVADFLLYIAM